MQRGKRITKPLAISEWMSITHPRSDVKCIFCKKEIGRLGVIIRLNHKTYNVYDWVHLGCLEGMRPSKVSVFGHASYQDIPVKSKTSGCSLCGLTSEKFPLLKFPRFYMHEKCIETAVIATKEIWLDNEKQLLAKMI